MGKATTWRWGNVPLPEAHLIGLGVGMLMHIFAPWTLSWPARRWTAFGWPLIVVGFRLAAWAVQTAATVNLQRPNELVRTGPYSVGRNPMYVAWTLLYLGIAFVSNAAWPLLILPIVLVVTHVLVVREERGLERRFGAAYRSYMGSVRRYL